MVNNLDLIKSDVNKYLDKIDLKELKAKIRNFRSLPRHKLSDKELMEEIYKVLEIDNHFILQPHFRTYPVGSYFYRIRKLLQPNISELKSVNDFWNAPQDLINSYQRLNKPKESLLYTAFDIETAIVETRLKENDFFCLMIYENIKPIKAVCIGTSFNDDLRLIEIEDFLAEEFCKPVGTGIEHFYRTSELIAKHFFDLPPEEIQDAWEYPSVQDRKKLNICFRPELGKKLLKLNGTLICKYGIDNTFSPLAIQDGFGEDLTPNIYHFDENLVKKIAPNFPGEYRKNPL
ncbi:RES domain-containing protein [Acinetobacter schindleri]|uniref:RES domain-containing protein n=1 Tax=Acinetobacter TaxID=469 RepID=UPI00235FDFF0|nr:RES domain-containing protein [Acinetobacter schindleri]WDE15365.1 RES domain-containing protein [Acinetobacter schindleri]